MKRLLILAVATLLASCMLDMPVQTGSVVINLPSRATIARELAGEELDYTVARVWLMSGATRINVGGLGYTESTSDSVVISGLLPDVYGVQVSFGQSEDGVLHSVVAYGTSDPFRISAGVTTPVVVTLQPQSVYSMEGTVGTPHVDVVAIGSDLYTLTADGALFENGVAFTDSALTGKHIQSITAGAFFATETTLAEELWINTDDGIYPLRNGVLVDDFSDAMTIGEAGLDVDTTFHFLTINHDNPAESSLVILAQGTGLESVIGTFITYSMSGDSATWEWYGWDVLDDVEGLGAIKDALTSVGEVVYDIKFDDRFIIAATALQTLLLPKDNMTDLIDYFMDLSDPAADMDLETVLGFFYIVTITADGQGKTIKTVEIADTYLYLGTNTANDPGNGLFVAQVNATTGAITADAQLVSETSGVGIREISYNATIGRVFARSDRELYVLVSGVLTKQIPGYAGLPGSLLAAEWDESASRLYIAGSDGVAYLNFSSD
jgi:hypothetical protein